MASGSNSYRNYRQYRKNRRRYETEKKYITSDCDYCYRESDMGSA